MNGRQNSSMRSSTIAFLTDVSSDQQQRGLETYLDIDRDTTARLGITPLQIDNTLYDAFGQRQVSVIYSAINQYHVVMEIDPRYTQYPDSLRDVYVSGSGGTPPGTATTNAPGGTVTPATATGHCHFSAVPSIAASGTTSSASAGTSSATLRHPPTPPRYATPLPTRSPIPATVLPPSAQRSPPRWKT